MCAHGCGWRAAVGAPLWRSVGTPHRSAFATFEQRFLAVIGQLRASRAGLRRTLEPRAGPQALSALCTGAAAARPVLTISGAMVINARARPRPRANDAGALAQLTGKSTLGQRVAETVGGRFLSAGAMFRQLAAQRGVSVAQL